MIPHTTRVKKHGILDESLLRVVILDKSYIIDLLNNREGTKTSKIKFITWTIGLEITMKQPYLISNVNYRMHFLRLVCIILLLVLSFKKFILHLCMNLRQLSSKVSGYWIFHFVEVELNELWMVSIVGKDWGLLSESLDGVVVRKLGKW
jgi:hypothetical protein